MAKERMQRCFNCGAELGVYVAYYGDLQTCGSAECGKAEREEYRARDEEARSRAERDDYDRYR